MIYASFFDVNQKGAGGRVSENTHSTFTLSRVELSDKNSFPYQASAFSF